MIYSKKGRSNRIIFKILVCLEKERLRAYVAHVRTISLTVGSPVAVLNSRSRRPPARSPNGVFRLFFSFSSIKSNQIISFGRNRDPSNGTETSDGASLTIKIAREPYRSPVLVARASCGSALGGFLLSTFFVFGDIVRQIFFGRLSRVPSRPISVVQET